MAQIDKPGLHFNTKLYTGVHKSITGVGFQPDFIKKIMQVTICFLMKQEVQLKLNLVTLVQEIFSRLVF